MKTLLCTVGLIISCHTFAASYNEQMSAAQSSFTTADYSTTIRLLEEALQKAQTPAQKASAHNALGWTYFKEKHYQRAKENLEKALALAEQAGDEITARKASNNLGVLAYTLGNYEQAQSQFSAPSSQRSAAADTYLDLIQQQQQSTTVNQYISAGITLRKKTQFSEAIQEYDKALAIVPNHSRALEYKGYAQFRLGQAQAAITTLNLALRADPSRLNSLINLMKALCSASETAKLSALLNQYHEQINNHTATIRNDRELLNTCGKAFIDSL